MVSRIEALFERRSRERAIRARSLAIAGLSALEREGVRAGVVGSLARGTMLQHSDIDFLILDSGGLPQEAIRSVLEPVLKKFPFDVIPFDTTWPEMRSILLNEVRHASDLQAHQPTP